MRCFYLGETEDLTEKTDDELKSIVPKKFHKSLITKPPRQAQVSIPLMITKKMKMELSYLGHSDKEISNMTPQQGWDLLNKGKKK